MKSQQLEGIEFVPATKAARALGISLATLRLYAEQGKIEAFLTPGGKWRYNVRSFLTLAKKATRARVTRQSAKPRHEEPLLPGVREADEANKNSMSQYVADAPRLSS